MSKLSSTILNKKFASVYNDQNYDLGLIQTNEISQHLFPHILIILYGSFCDAIDEGRIYNYAHVSIALQKGTLCRLIIRVSPAAVQYFLIVDYCS